MNTIFVQIASYRDPELVPTIRDCIAKAKHPENLTFGVCWQKDETESLEEFKDDPRFKIIEIPWNESKGLCWARSLIQKLWDGEKYTMQIDSHHRFAPNWDTDLIEMMGLTNSEKPILTAYAGMYSPKNNVLMNFEPYKMVADKFTPSGTILFYPSSIENWQTLNAPIPARFVSGHFFFTLGIHCKEYKYDPNLYFAGDEISLSIRSYTLGYDLFHPHKLVIWHEYTREGRTKHWTDFNEENKKSGKVESNWWEMDSESKKRLRHMLREEDNQIDLGEYDLGTVRSHHDYELYAGICFKNRKLHPDTKKGINPPINDYSDWFELKEETYKLSLDIPKTDNFKFIYVGVEDVEGNVLYREDLYEYKPLLKVEFNSVKPPYKWIYWPVDQNDNWYDRVDSVI
jgi:Glycosyltransferase (GlcNAc)